MAPSLADGRMMRWSHHGHITFILPSFAGLVNDKCLRHKEKAIPFTLLASKLHCLADAFTSKLLIEARTIL